MDKINTMPRHVWRMQQRRRRRRQRVRSLVRMGCLGLFAILLVLTAKLLFPLFSIEWGELFTALVGKQSEKIISVEYLGQKDYPTGCESVTAVMALRYVGIDITVDEFIENYLPKGEFWVDENGQAYGDDPYQCFVGDPYSSSGFGCFAPALAEGLEKAAPGKTVLNLTGCTIEELCKKYIKKGIPVIFWATINMKEPTAGRTWTLQDTGETFTWTAGEHCLLLVGYDNNNYYFNDPYQDKGLTAYEKSIVDMRYQQMGSQALVLK